MATLSNDVYQLFPQLDPQPTSTPSAPPSPSAPPGPVSTASITDFPTEAPNPNSEASAKAPDAKAGIIAGAVIGGLSFVVGLWFLQWRSYQVRERRAGALAETTMKGSETTFSRPQTKGVAPLDGLRRDQAGLQMREMGNSCEPLIQNEARRCIRHGEETSSSLREYSR